MTRTEGLVKCIPCDTVYGTIYADQINDTAVFANRTVPDTIPRRCTVCSVILSRVV